MECWSQCRGVDHQCSAVELEPDDLDEVAGEVGADSEQLGRVGIGVEVEVDLHQSVIDCMHDGRLAEAVLER